MQEVEMALNLHSEVPSSYHLTPASSTPSRSSCPTSASCTRRSRACTSSSSTVECVKELGETVVCTITAHYLALTVDDWACQSWGFCKPVAKYPDDREALREVIRRVRICGYQSCGRTRNMDIIYRSPSLLPGLRLCTTPTTEEVTRDAYVGLCSGYLYLSHPSSSHCTSARVIWRPGQARGSCLGERKSKYRRCGRRVKTALCRSGQERS